MKRILATLLSLTLALGLVACGGGTTSNGTASTGGSQSTGTQAGNTSGSPGGVGDHETIKIAIGEVVLNDESVIRANYFKNYIAPRYNVEFMFSEACTTTDEVMTFIENAAIAGCQGIINYYPMDTEQLVQLCREKGMVYIENGNRNDHSESTFTGGYDNFAGGFAANQQTTGKLFYDYLQETLDPTEEHGFIVTSGGAYNGNEQQYEISHNMLTAIQDIYGLEFDATIDALVTSSSPVEATNSLGLEVYVYPGMASQDGWLQGLSAALQTGRYDYCLYSRQDFVDSAVTVEEVERSYNKDIKVIAFGSFGDSLTNAFNTQDQFGNPSLNMSTVKFTTLVSAMAFVEIYNALTGHMDVLLNGNGEAPDLTFNMQAVTGPEMLAEMSSWDTDGNWVADYDLIDSCLGIVNPDLTPEQIQANFDAVTYETIKARLG